MKTYLTLTIAALSFFSCVNKELDEAILKAIEIPVVQAEGRTEGCANFYPVYKGDTLRLTGCYKESIKYRSTEQIISFMRDSNGEIVLFKPDIILPGRISQETYNKFKEHVKKGFDK